MSAHQDFQPVEVSRPTFLEGMRGLAAWMVVFGHACNTFFPTLTNAAGPAIAVDESLKFLAYTPLSLPFRAHFAVIFFFVHSGLVLSFRYFVSGRDQRDVVSAAGRRYFRLAIPAAGSILFGYVLLSFGAIETLRVADLTGSEWLRAHFNFAPNFLEAIKQMTYQNYVGGVPAETNYNSSLWTIKLELIGSLFVFAILYVFGRKSWRWYVYPVLSLIGLHLYLFAFVAGIAICDTYVNHPHFIQKLRPLGYLLLAMGLIAGCFSPGSEAYWFYSVTKPFASYRFMAAVQTLSACFIILGALATNGFGGVMNRPFFQFLGRISYSVYLLHLAILCSVGTHLYLWLLANEQSRLTSALVATLISVFTILILAVPYRRFVDVPSIAIAKLCQQKIFQALAWRAPHN